LKQQQDGK